MASRLADCPNRAPQRPAEPNGPRPQASPPPSSKCVNTIVTNTGTDAADTNNTTYDIANSNTPSSPLALSAATVAPIHNDNHNAGLTQATPAITPINFAANPRRAGYTANANAGGSKHVAIATPNPANVNSNRSKNPNTTPTNRHTNSSTPAPATPSINKNGFDNNRHKNAAAASNTDRPACPANPSPKESAAPMNNATTAGATIIDGTYTNARTPDSANNSKPRTLDPSAARAAVNINTTTNMTNPSANVKAYGRNHPGPPPVPPPPPKPPPSPPSAPAATDRNRSVTHPRLIAKSHNAPSNGDAATRAADPSTRQGATPSTGPTSDEDPDADPEAPSGPHGPNANDEPDPHGPPADSTSTAEPPDAAAGDPSA
jgi:hypothetical protein